MNDSTQQPTSKGFLTSGTYKIIFILSLLILIILIGFALLSNTGQNNINKLEPGSPSVNKEKEYFLYFPKLPEFESDFNSMKPVIRTTNREDVATFLVEEFFKGPTVEERSKGLGGLYSFSFEGESNCNEKDFQVNIEEEIAYIKFCRPTLLIGDIAPEFRMSMDLTLTQLDGVKRVIIFNQDGECWNQLSEEDNTCLVE